MTRFVMLGGALLVAASQAGAQSIPNVGAAKRAAQHAANATDRHTATMTADQSPQAKTATGETVRPVIRDTVAAVVTPTVRGTATVVAERADTNAAVTFLRETFSYEKGGRRDPFVSLMSSGEIRPMISDLRLSGVLVDPVGRNSVAVLNDLSSKEQYRVRVGQTLGRLRVTQISLRQVTFTIEEFGFSRQQVLTLGDSTQARTK